MKLNPLPLLLIYRASFIAALTFTTYMALSNPANIAVHIEIWDKLQHATAFIVLSLLLDLSLPRYRSRRLLHPAQTALLLCYGMMLEWIQSYTPYRDASVYDVLADSAGLFCYWLIYFVSHTSNHHTGNKTHPRR